MNRSKLLKGFVSHRAFDGREVRESVCGVSEIGGVCHVSLQSGWCIPLSDDEVRVLGCSGVVEVSLSAYRVSRRRLVDDIDWEARHWELFKALAGSLVNVHKEGGSLVDDTNRLLGVYIADLKRRGLYES